MEFTPSALIGRLSHVIFSSIVQYLHVDSEDDEEDDNDDDDSDACMCFSYSHVYDICMAHMR